MRPDTTSANESEAAEYAAVQGRDEWVGGDVGDQEQTREDINRDRAAVADLRAWQIRTFPVLWTCPRCETDHRHGDPSDPFGCVDCGFRQDPT